MKTNIHVLILLFAGFSLSATAAPPQAPLTVAVQGDGMVTSDPAGITCPTDCSKSYKKGTTVTLTATADINSSFLGWSGACAGTDLVCVIKVTAPMDVAAMFDTAIVVYPAPVPKTGKTVCSESGGYGALIDCADTGQDGEHQTGVPWPTPRFLDNNDGTVQDNLTGLIWLKDANCFGPQISWVSAEAAVQTLAEPICGLSDGSVAGGWRIPNLREMLSLIDYGNVLKGLPTIPALPTGHPFLNVQLGTDVVWYFTSTTGGPYLVNMQWGNVSSGGALTSMWPVKGP